MVSPHRRIALGACSQRRTKHPKSRSFERPAGAGPRITVGVATFLTEVGFFDSRLAKINALVRPPDNLSSYEEPALVEVFSAHSELQPPERVILDRIATWLTGRRMLDVGVGGGRTTLHFAQVVGSYVGVDYAQPMVDACAARLADRFPEAVFALGDVRDLSAFDSGEFDFVLFSYNGLDTLDHEDRLRALRELRRVVSQHGLLCFSSHNIYGLARLYVGDRKRWVKSLAFRALNGSVRSLSVNPYATVRDGTGHFRMIQYYVRPSESLEQLDATGFAVTDVFGLDGRRIEIVDVDRAEDAWLYSLASPSGPPS
jgi:ubiquinone/menaquinone biosynthesis C-methylase UbiE